MDFWKVLDGFWMVCGWSFDCFWMEKNGWILEGFSMNVGGILMDFWKVFGWILDGFWMDCGWSLDCFWMV